MGSKIYVITWEGAQSAPPEKWLIMQQIILFRVEYEFYMV